MKQPDTVIRGLWFPFLWKNGDPNNLCLMYLTIKFHIYIYIHKLYTYIYIYIWYVCLTWKSNWEKTNLIKSHQIKPEFHLALKWKFLGPTQPSTKVPMSLLPWLALGRGALLAKGNQLNQHLTKTDAWFFSNALVSKTDELAVFGGWPLFLGVFCVVKP